MRAIGHRPALPTDHPDSLCDITLAPPVPGARDLLVEVRAISVNPVDTRVRKGGGPGGGNPRVLGWDAAGVVVRTGADVTLFAPGDEVYYAGTITRDGAYAELHCVDERLVGAKPAGIGFAEAAALPLTSITAWELLFDRLRVPSEGAGALLILGAAGGVGSIAIQLARTRTDATVIATASRPESEAWVRELGAHHVVDHRRPLAPQLRALAPEGVRYVLGLTRVEDHFDALIEAMAPEAALGLIETPETPLAVDKLKPKSLSLHWESMFTRSIYATCDMAAQGRILNEVAAAIDAEQIRSTLREHLGTIRADNVRRAHLLIESGRAIGKVVLAGFG